MSLHDVTVQSAVHHHRAFHVHLVAHLEQTEVAAVQGFLHGSNGISTVLDFHHGEADAVVRHALVYSEFINKRTFQRKVDVLLIMLDSHYCGHFFYNSTKHKLSSLYILFEVQSYCIRCKRPNYLSSFDIKMYMNLRMSRFFCTFASS